MRKIEVLGAAMLLLGACQRDTTPPIVTVTTGPTDGSTVNFDSFCYPIVISDNVSRDSDLSLRTNFDDKGWSGWSNDMTPCFRGVADGRHTFSAQAKDGAGNISGILRREFAVDTIFD